MALFQLFFFFTGLVFKVTDDEPTQNVYNSVKLQHEYTRKRTVQNLANEVMCPVWFTPRNGTCHCGYSLHDVVTCDEYTEEITVLDCYCMTTDTTCNKAVVGDCFYNCGNLSQKAQDILYHKAPSNCKYLHRAGTLCGECEVNYFSRTYSYDMDCIKCTHPDNWWLYITVAFLPLTVYVVVILVCRISVVSPKLHVFVFFAQVLTAPINVRAIILNTKHSPFIVTAFFATVYGIWNLDFFRTMIPSVCLYLSALQVLALDYLIAVYPIHTGRTTSIWYQTIDNHMETISLFFCTVSKRMEYSDVNCGFICHLLHSFNNKIT